jgi:gas vesicle structural protein
MISEESLCENPKKEVERSRSLIYSETERVSLCEILDRILNKGAMVAGEVTISVANVDLLSLDLRLLLTSVDTLRRKMEQESIKVIGDR